MLKAFRIILKVAAWSIAAVVVLFTSSCVLFFNPQLRHDLFGGDHSASANLGDTGLVVTVELVNNVSHLAEFKRYLVVNGKGAHVSKEIASDHGGFPRANLYRTGEGSYVVAGSLDAWLISIDEVEIKPYSGRYVANASRESTERVASQSTYYDGLTYLGAFDFASEKGQPVGSVSRGRFKFIPPDIQAEYIRNPGG